jgi:alpha-glucosidase
MKTILLCCSAILLIDSPRNATAAPLQLTSPDGKWVIGLASADSGSFGYTLTAQGTPLISHSALGLDFGTAGKAPANDWKITDTKTRRINSTWKPLWGKRAVVPDRYQETTVELTGPGAPFDHIDITVRAYDDGMAFRYSIPEKAKGNPAKATADLTEYNFAGDFTAWFYNHEQHNLGPDKLSTLTGNREPVMTVQAADNTFLALHEADLRSGEPLQLTKSGPTSFRALAAPGEIAPSYTGPWRVIFYGTTPGAMVDSHLIELLNPESTGDFSWVKPGVAVWDWRTNGAEIPGFKYGMNLPSWIRMVDFAASNGIKHLVLDADWYGPEFGKDSDPVKGDKAGDVKKLIAYGKSKNVGIWLYLNDVGGRKFPLEETLAHYGEWGAAGVKYGFMSGNPEEKNARTRQITELCAKNKLLCDFHDDPVHPYGQMRTWPNAVTREFCFAQLDSKRVFQPKTFVTTVFVNMLSGPLDMNNGFFDLRQGPTTRVDNPMECPSTVVAEAARTLITFSGATIIPDIPEYYQKYPELLRFIADQQQPWRESKTLSGVIGEHIVMARQSAKGAWLVGAATNEEARELDVKLDFLPPGIYQATIVQDGEDGHYQKNRETHRVEKRQVGSTDTLRLKLAPGGGACVILEKSPAPTKH